MNDSAENRVRTEDAVETADGLISALTYLHETAPITDQHMLRSPISAILNAVRHELQRARSVYTRSQSIRR